jgi:hypothetical protein
MCLVGLDLLLQLAEISFLEVQVFVLIYFIDRLILNTCGNFPQLSLLFLEVFRISNLLAKVSDVLKALFFRQVALLSCLDLPLKLKLLLVFRICSTQENSKKSERRVPWQTSLHIMGDIPKQLGKFHAQFKREPDDDERVLSEVAFFVEDNVPEHNHGNYAEAVEDECSEHEFTD